MPNPLKGQLSVPPLTRVVKALLIAQVTIFVIDLLLRQFAGISLTPIFGFVPARLAQAWIWQPLTYAFLHAGPTHLLFNALILWTLGGELELLWGKQLFTVYYFLCAFGAALCYGLLAVLSSSVSPGAPLVGSSGAMYGLLLAYGILFGERVLYFFMLFPIQAKYFVMILGGIELVSSVSESGVSHIAHLGGMVTGFLTMMALARWRQGQKFGLHRDIQDTEARQKRLRGAKHLRLVGKDDEDDSSKPKTWH